jgi:hypothetical protein
VEPRNRPVVASPRRSDDEGCDREPTRAQGGRPLAQPEPLDTPAGRRDRVVHRESRPCETAQHPSLGDDITDLAADGEERLARRDRVRYAGGPGRESAKQHRGADDGGQVAAPRRSLERLGPEARGDPEIAGLLGEHTGPAGVPDLPRIRTDPTCQREPFLDRVRGRADVTRHEEHPDHTGEPEEEHLVGP